MFFIFQRTFFIYRASTVVPRTEPAFITVFSLFKALALNMQPQQMMVDDSALSTSDLLNSCINLL